LADIWKGICRTFGANVMKLQSEGEMYEKEDFSTGTDVHFLTGSAMASGKNKTKGCQL
jgi:hypothetical protein